MGWIHAPHLPPPRTRRRRPTSRFPSRDFNRPGPGGRANPSGVARIPRPVRGPNDGVGFTHRTAATPNPSAKADIAFSQPRFQSPGGGGSGESSGCRSNPAARAATERWVRIHAPHLPPPRTRRRRPTSRFPSRDFNRLGAGIGRTPRVSFESRCPCGDRTMGLDSRTAPAATRNPSAKADIAFSQPRFQSPGTGDRANPPVSFESRCPCGDRKMGSDSRTAPAAAPNPSAKADIAFSQPRFQSPDFNRPISIARVRGRRVHACGLACAWNVRARPIRFCGTSDSWRRWTIDFRKSAPPPSSAWG
jgi:hypothetical protein